MKRPVLLLLPILLFLQGAAWALTLSGFDSPVSMQADPEDGSYYVSCAVAGPPDKKSSGYISKISSSGNIVIQKYIGGRDGAAALETPRGMVCAGQELLVAHLNGVRIFDRRNGKPLRSVDLGAFNPQYLNDLAVDAAGNIFVTDTLADAVYKIDARNGYTPSVFRSGAVLGHPRGITINPRNKNLLVTTWGSGQILELDPAGRVHVLKKGLSELDGIDCDAQGNLYVSSFEKGEIYKIAFYGRGPLSTFLGGLTTPADISFDKKKNELLIPSYRGHSVTTVPANYRQT